MPYRHPAAEAALTDCLGQLALLLRSGVGREEALHILQRGEDHPALRALLAALETEARGGKPLAEGLARPPRPLQAWPAFLLARLREAEAEGELAEELARLAAYREAMQRGAVDLHYPLVYPAVLLGIVLLLVVFVSTFVMPTFTEMFRGFGADLPAPTLWLLALGEGRAWPAALGLLALGGVLWWGARRQSAWFGRLQLGMPGYRRIYSRLASVQFLRTYALAQTGKPLDAATALETSAAEVDNGAYAAALRRAAERARAGAALADALEAQSLVPRKLVRAAAVGERSGQTAALFTTLAEIYARQAAHMREPAAKLASLVLTIVLGVLIGGLLLALYLPIFKIGQVI